MEWGKHFERIKFLHCKRDSNSCEDTLAKFAITSPQDWGAYELCPPEYCNN